MVGGKSGENLSQFPKIIREKMLFEDSAERTNLGLGDFLPDLPATSWESGTT
jgi:hypothetical protein